MASAIRVMTSNRLAGEQVAQLKNIIEEGKMFFGNDASATDSELKKGYCLVLLKDGIPIGYAKIEENLKRSYFGVSVTYVKESERRMGYGRLLLKVTFGIARKGGYREIDLGVPTLGMINSLRKLEQSKLPKYFSGLTIPKDPRERVKIAIKPRLR